MNLDLTILIVDDNIALRRLMRMTLKKLGFSNIVEAVDGIGALEELKKQNIDLVLSDLQMPNMDGLKLLETIRKDEKLKATPFIMVTANGQKEMVFEAINIGATNFIVKPFSPETISKKISAVFEK